MNSLIFPSRLDLSMNVGSQPPASTYEKKRGTRMAGRR